MAQLAQDRSWNHLRRARARSSYPADWYIEDNDPVGQDPEHQRHEFTMQSVLLAWRERTKQKHLLVGCEMTCRWDSKEPRVGVDPDVYVVERPPGDRRGYIGSLKTWKKDNHPPILAIEVVSNSRPKKDYRYSPEKHDLLGTFELWVFDPLLCGYTEEQSPVYLQIFQRETNDELVQKYAGDGPFRSDALDAWVMVINGELVIANDREGNDRWPTLEEAERRRADEHAKRAEVERKRAEAEKKRAQSEKKRAEAEKERAEAEKERAEAEKERAESEKNRAEAERIAKEEALRRAEDEAKRANEALARIAELEAMLAKRG